MSFWDDLFSGGVGFNDPTVNTGTDNGFSWNDFNASNPDGSYDPRLDPGIPSIGNTYGGGGDLYGNNPNNFYVPAVPGSSSGGSSSGGKAPGTTLGGLSGPGGIPWATLIPMIATGLGALAQRHNISNATGQLQQGVKDANNLVSGIYGDSKSMYMPYVQGGQQAFANAQNMAYKPMAGNFAPLSGLTLGNMSGRR